MLNGIVRLGERLLDAPGATMWQGQLWIAYRTVAGTLAVRNVPVDGDPRSGTSTDLGLPAKGQPGLAAWNNRLWLAYVGPDLRHFLTSSPDGRVFDPPQETGVLNNEWAPAITG